MSDPGYRRVRYSFSFSAASVVSIGPKEELFEVTVWATFTNTGWLSHPLYPTEQYGVVVYGANIEFDAPRPSGLFGGKVYYYFTINSRINEMQLIPWAPKEKRVFEGISKSEIWYNVIELADLRQVLGSGGYLDAFQIPSQFSPPALLPPPPQPLPQASPASAPQTPSSKATPPRPPPSRKAIAPQQPVQAVIKPRTRRRLDLQPRTGFFCFRWPGSPPAKEVLVTGIYDAWGRKRVEKLIWSSKHESWELTLKVSVPGDKKFIKYSYIVDGVEKYSNFDRRNDTIVNGESPKCNVITPNDISEPLPVFTKYTGMSAAYGVDTARFLCVFSAPLPQAQPNAKFAFAGGDIAMHNVNAGELKFSDISNLWEIRIVFDWDPQVDKFHYQLREFQGGDWRTFIHTDLVSEDVTMKLDPDIQARRRGPVPTVKRNYIVVANTQRVEWPLTEYITPMGKYTFFWSAPTSPTHINRVIVEGPFTQDPSVKETRDLKRLPDGTWSLTLEIPARRMRYRYLVDGMYQTNWHEHREMDEMNERWNFLEERDFVVEDYDEDDLDITISRSTLQGLLEGSLALDRLPSEVQELVKPGLSKPSVRSMGFELSDRAKAARGLS
ncbi:hypothetical protein TWF281_002656 [Arthrobotrys megalospora]